MKNKKDLNRYLAILRKDNEELERLTVAEVER
jgi:hypothetical protein